MSCLSKLDNRVKGKLAESLVIDGRGRRFGRSGMVRMLLQNCFTQVAPSEVVAGRLASGRVAKFIRGGMVLAFFWSIGWKIILDTMLMEG